MSLPTNRDELVKVLTAFRDQKPAGNATIPWGNNVGGYEYKTHILDMFFFLREHVRGTVLYTDVLSERL